MILRKSPRKKGGLGSDYAVKKPGREARDYNMSEIEGEREGERKREKERESGRKRERERIFRLIRL